MNEASSKYVDQIAVEKLIAEKLSLVHQMPKRVSPGQRITYDDFAALSLLPAKLLERRDGPNCELEFDSALQTAFPENNRVHVRYYQTNQSPARAIVIFVHGLWEDNREIYQFLISQLNGYSLDIYAFCLPYHYERKPTSSLFSGEFFWSADIDRSALAYKQAVYDLAQLYRMVKTRATVPVWIAGFSMGGGIALSLTKLMALDGVFAINPVCNMSELVWNSQLFSPIRKDLDAAGVGFAELKERYALFEPLNSSAVQTDLHRIILAYSLYDQINDQANYVLLRTKWSLPNVISYKAGHLNILRVPRLGLDIAQSARSEHLEGQIVEDYGL